MNPGIADMLLDNYALEALRDVADADYISARMCFRAKLFRQALWGSQQALEKYIKAILLLRRIPWTKPEHRFNILLPALENHFPLNLKSETRAYIARIDAWEADRYSTYSYSAERSAIVFLDLAVWDVRRYCIIYQGASTSEGKSLNDELYLRHIHDAEAMPPQRYRTHFPGYLENVMEQCKSEAKSALLWNNFFFGTRIRHSNTNFRDSLCIANSVIANYPEIIPELGKYVYLPPAIRPKKPDHRREKLQDNQPAMWKLRSEKFRNQTDPLLEAKLQRKLHAPRR